MINLWSFAYPTHFALRLDHEAIDPNYLTITYELHSRMAINLAMYLAWGTYDQLSHNRWTRVSTIASSQATTSSINIIYPLCQDAFESWWFSGIIFFFISFFISFFLLALCKDADWFLELQIENIGITNNLRFLENYAKQLYAIFEILGHCIKKVIKTVCTAN